MTTGTKWNRASPSSIHDGDRVLESHPGRRVGRAAWDSSWVWLQTQASRTFDPMKPTWQLPDSFFSPFLESGYDISSG